LRERVVDRVGRGRVATRDEERDKGAESDADEKGRDSHPIRVARGSDSVNVSLQRDASASLARKQG